MVRRVRDLRAHLSCSPDLVGSGVSERRWPATNDRCISDGYPVSRWSASSITSVAKRLDGGRNMPMPPGGGKQALCKYEVGNRSDMRQRAKSARRLCSWNFYSTDSNIPMSQWLGNPGAAVHRKYQKMKSCRSLCSCDIIGPATPTQCRVRKRSDNNLSYARASEKPSILFIQISP